MSDLGVSTVEDPRMTTADLLPSWRRGPALDSVVAFLDAVTELPVEARVACFDHDGTLWCERPGYVQFDFLVAVLRQATETDPALAHRAEFKAVLSADVAAMDELGLGRVAMALVGLCQGISPEDFRSKVRDFMAHAVHPTLGRLHRECVYQPMVELIAALRDRDVAVMIVTGGGTEFVRAVSHDLYSVAPECVVGTMVDYEFGRDVDGRPRLLRTGAVVGSVNEGSSKVTAIQTQLGRRPVLAGGNSGGDKEMLEWAVSKGAPSLALLVDHDDADREFAYASTAQSFTEPEPIVDVAAREGWTVISMARDWSQIFVPRS